MGIVEKFRGKETNKTVYWFFAAGLLFVGAYQAWLDEHHNTEMVIAQRQQAEIEKGDLQRKLGGKDAQIDYLKSHQTVTFNPTITMPHAHTAASLRLSKFASSYFQENDQTKTIGFVEGKPVSFNFFYSNTGTAAAIETKAFAKAYVVPNSSLEIEKKLGLEFKNLSRASLNRQSGSTVEPDGKPDDYWFTGASDSPLDADEIKRLVDGKEVVYLLSIVTYKDPEGAHVIELCRWLQPPPFKPEVWHYCHG